MVSDERELLRELPGDESLETAGIPAAPRRRRGRRVVSFLAGFLVVVLGAEMAVRIVHNHLAPPHLYISVPAQTDVLSMDTLRAHGIRSDLTFVGTSMVRRDIDANQVEKLVPGIKWAHNVALSGAQADVVNRWLLQEVLPRLKPRRVVWGISSLDFNSGRTDHPVAQYQNARATEQGFYGDLDRIMWNSYLSLYRDDLRDPYSLYLSARGNTTSIRDHRSLSVLATPGMGYPYRTPAQLKKLARSELKYARDTQLHDFTIGKSELDSYRGVLSTLKSKGIPTVIVIMPVPTNYLNAHPHGASDFEHWKQVVTAIAEQEHVQVFDMSRTMPDSGFIDAEHLLVPDAHSFTRLLSARLRAIGW